MFVCTRDPSLLYSRGHNWNNITHSMPGYCMAASTKCLIYQEKGSGWYICACYPSPLFQNWYSLISQSEKLYFQFSRYCQLKALAAIGHVLDHMIVAWARVTLSLSTISPLYM